MIKLKVLLGNFIGHFNTISAHKFQVFLCMKKAGMPLRGLLHDLSKYHPEEFFVGVKYYQHGKRSPNSAQRELYGFSPAWLHHKGRNKHHHEYWMDYDQREQAEKIVPVKMPFKYIVEMFCDRIAAAKIYKGKEYTDQTPLQYYARRETYDYLIHKDTQKKLLALLNCLAKRGEAETFAYIRRLLRNM